MADRMTPGWPEVPDFGVVLVGHIAEVPAEGLPLFLAGLEGSAAARYRLWAEELSEHAGVLNECAAREDQIAALAAEVFPISEECQSAVDAALPDAIATYYEVFASHPVLDQLYLQSEAELQGAQAWAGMSAEVADKSTADALARCTALEQESSRAVKRLLDEIAGPRGSAR
jgi:hypothetical protein